MLTLFVKRKVNRAIYFLLFWVSSGVQYILFQFGARDAVSGELHGNAHGYKLVELH